MAHEGVLDQGVEGGDDEDRDASVVYLEHNVGIQLRVTGEEVACAAGKQAEHCSTHESEERPAQRAMVVMGLSS